MYIDPNSNAYPSVMGDAGLTKFEFAVIEIAKGLASNPSYHNSSQEVAARAAINQAVALMDGINNFWKDLSNANEGRKGPEYMKQFLQGE